jgi:hypothetical protein
MGPRKSTVKDNRHELQISAPLETSVDLRKLLSRFFSIGVLERLQGQQKRGLWDDELSPGLECDSETPRCTKILSLDH